MSLHAKISYIKSFIRIIGFLFLIKSIILGSIILIIAELVGILEEFYEK